MKIEYKNRRSHKSSDDELFDIINGPGKFDFIVKAFCINSGERNKTEFLLKENSGPIKFKTPHPIKIIINSILWEDDSGESWLFDGVEAKGGNVEGCYNTSHHTGYMKIV